jgi:hypothetical protein
MKEGEAVSVTHVPGKARLLLFNDRIAFDHGIKMHPQDWMKSAGISYQRAVPHSIADRWDFWNCEGVHETLPPFLRISDETPASYVGFGLSDEMAQEIELLWLEKVKP